MIRCRAGEGLKSDELHFETRSGTLTVKHTKDGLFHLSVPSFPPTDPQPGTREDMCDILEARPSSKQFLRFSNRHLPVATGSYLH